MKNQSGINCQNKHCDRTYDFHHPSIHFLFVFLGVLVSDLLQAL